ncbi:MAG: substrate-binding domain-containing protein [Pseudomonadota bacterium]
MKPLPTLADVACLAQVSTATVSRVLNAPDRVREETRRRVQEAVAQLGYTPNFGARALASNRTRTVGAVIPTMENAIFARGLQALQEELARADVTLLVATSNYDPAREEAQIRTLLGRGVEGLVLIGEEREAHVYDLIRQRGIPAVLVWTWRADCPWPCVGFDNRASARSIAERALALGHRRIAMIAGVTAGNDRARQRVEGVREALEAAGLRLDGDLLVEAEYSLAAGRDAALGLLARRPRPTALVCGNDVLAAGAVAAAREAGLDVPGDVSVSGFDDIDLAKVVYPPIATVHVPHRRMGLSAARLLLALDAGERRPESRRFDTEIVEGGSLGPAPAER